MSTKEKLQRLVFPKGIIYTKKKEAFRTEKVNSIFALIADAAKGSEENKKGTTKALPCLSPSAEREGFEPPEVLPSTVFKTAAFDRSAISPAQM